MNYEDFIKPTEQPEETEELNEDIQPDESVENSVELDVQKAVVESLAADKAEQNVEIERLRKENNAMSSKISDLTAMIVKLRSELEKVGDLLSKNSEVQKSSQIALLDRNPEIGDRFEGETRDHVLEVIKEARDASENTGRVRRAQLLESILVANEPCGTLAKKRQQLAKLFADNQNVINGQVINELDKLNITYKIGDKYLLIGEIINRTY